jgi:hypothetical protein
LSYRYFENTLSSDTTGSAIIKGFQAMINAEFYNSPTAFIVQEEEVFASGSYIDVDVRINRGINTYTGEKLGDDYKLLIFRDLDHSTHIGMLYYFDSNYWLVQNTEIIKNIATSATVRRCNNVLRWFDQEGNYYSEPCVIDYPLKRPVDSVGTQNLSTPNGFIQLMCQLNTRTKNIHPNQRFLFGNSTNWTCLRIFGVGVKNFMNLETYDNDSAKLLYLEAGTYFVDESSDDLINGIADRYLIPSSGSSSANIVFTPSDNNINQGDTNIYIVRRYIGTVATTASFVFAINDSLVPTDHYVFSSVSGSAFSIYNHELYLDNTLNILCSSASSGSRIINFNLRDRW